MGEGNTLAKKIPYSAFTAYFIFGIVILYIIGHFINRGVNYMAPVIPVETVRIDSIGIPQTYSGIIIRDERVHYAPRSGELVFFVGEGERVRAGTHIASIQDSNEVAIINRDMLALDRDAIRVDAMRSDYTDPNVIRLNNHIKGQVNNRAHSFTSTNFNDLFILRDNLNQSINHRNQFIISGSIQAVGDYARRQTELLNRMDIHSTNLYARSGGIMTPVLDRLENIFTLSNMESLTREQLNFTPDTIPLFPPQQLEANEPAFKIVGNTWYIAVYIPNEMIQNYQTGQTHTLYVENPVVGDFVPMSLRIIHIEPHTRDSRVIFRSTRYIMDFLHQRNVNIRTTQRVEVGLKIPNTAVVSREYYVIPLPFLHGLLEHELLVYSNEGTVSIPVVVAEMAGAFVHVCTDTAGLSLGDVLSDGLGNRHTVSQIKTVQGIYRANNGFADFRVIDTDELITERGGSTLLCPVRNRGSLNEFDSIVVDASLVSDGQMLW
jgi:hypothetical protein